MSLPVVSVRREAHFNAAHRLHNPKWTAEKNREVFGKCNNPHYHGHNYRLIVEVKGQTDPETGYVVDTKWLANLIREKVEDRFDHRNLNEEVDEFSELNPTAENIAVVIWHFLRPYIDNNHELTVELYETERNSVRFAGNYR